MKKIMMTAFAALLLAMPAVQAQKVNESAIRSKIAKSDADIADAKKNAKAATWINRGKIFMEAAAEPTKDLFIGQESMLLKLAMGDPASTGAETLNNNQFEAWVYPYVTVYLKDGKVAAWTQTKWVVENAPEKAIEAYAKAAEVDPKAAPKAKEGLQQVSDFCSQAGNAGLDTGMHAASADAFATAYAAQAVPVYGKADPSLLYYAGNLRTMDGVNNPASYALGAEYLNKALEQGYADEAGYLYYYLFHCYYGQKDADPANVVKAKDTLLAGISKFPKNENILEALIQLYTVEEGVGDPADLVAMIDASLAENPENVDLWFGRGRSFSALKNFDEAIASFAKVTEIQPDLFDGNYWLGMFYILKADEENRIIQEERQYNSTSAYEDDLKAVTAIYMQAVPWLEKAHQIKPEDLQALDYLKSLCFRVRDEEGMMAKYEKYNAEFKKLKGE